MLRNTWWDPSIKLHDPLPPNWEDLSDESQSGFMGFNSVWRQDLPRNFGVVIPGKLYRSGIPWTYQLEWLHEIHKIQNIISLMGGDWLDTKELERLWISHQQFNVLQRRALTKARVWEVVDLIETLDWPTLIHCLKGSVRTWQVIAWHQLWVQGIWRMKVHWSMIRYGNINTSSHKEVSRY